MVTRAGSVWPGEHSPTETVARLVPALRNSMAYESELIRGAGLDGYVRIRESVARAENEVAVAAFLGVSQDTAQAVMRLDYLFAD